MKDYNPTQDTLCKKKKMKKEKLIRLTDEEIVQIIRPEENFERWSNFIFPHHKTKEIRGTRKKSWDVTLSNGLSAEASITIESSSSQKAYTCRTYDVFLALVKIFNDRDMPNEPFYTSLREIAKNMGVSTSGQWLKNIKIEIECLYKTTLSWILSYTLEEKHTSLSSQHILDTYDYYSVTGKISKEGFKTSCRIRFDERIRKNLQEKRTIPVNWTSRKKITSQVAKVLYNRIDNLLAKHSILERTATNLVNDLELSKGRYKYKSQRKELVQKLKQQLNGLILSNLSTIIVEIKETADNKDWKCIFRTKKRKNITGKTSLPILNKDSLKREYLISEITKVVGGEDKNRDLYNVFALHYSNNMIFRALGEYKESVNNNPEIKKKQSYFTTTMHIIAHKMGLEWIKPCEITCKYRKSTKV